MRLQSLSCISSLSKQQKVHTVLEKDSGDRQSPGYHGQCSQILEGGAQSEQDFGKKADLLVHIDAIPLIGNNLE
jgi:hypothetical protein